MRHILIALPLAIAALPSWAQLAPNAINASTTAGQPSAKPLTPRIEMIKRIAPAGWEGFAKDGVDMARSSNFAPLPSEPWGSAFARWLNHEGLSGTLDERNKRYFINDPSSTESLDQRQQLAGPTKNPAGYLTLNAGERLSTQLAQWVAQQGYVLNWEASGSMPGRVRDVLVEGSWAASTDQLHDVLAKVLSPFGFVASIVESQKTIVVRNQSTAQP